MRMGRVITECFYVMMLCAAVSLAQDIKTGRPQSPSRPQGPCDIYGAAGDPCVAAHSTTRALYHSYNGPLYQVLRQSDGKTLNIGVVRAASSPVPDAGGYANAAEQDAFCANTYCWISKVYDQSPKHNDLAQAPRGGFSGPAMGGSNNLPLADAAPVTVMGHKVYGIFIEPGMGLRMDDTRGTAVDDQAEGQYWVINGLHFNSGCCFDYGNAEIDSRDDDNGTMETTYYGDATPWYHGNPPGPWVMTDQENNLVGCVNADGSKLCGRLPNIKWRFVTAMAKGEPHHWSSLGGDAQVGALAVMFDGPRIDSSYDPMRKQGAILLGNGGDNSNGSQGTFYEGAMTAANTFPSDATDQLVQANVVAAAYRVQSLSLASASSSPSSGIQTFSPKSAGQTKVTFTNTTQSSVKSLKLSLSVPDKQWAAVVQGTNEMSKTFSDAVEPGGTVSATFTVTSGPKTINGELVANASWADASSGARRTETMAEKVRNAAPVRINEFRIGSGSPTNLTDSFIELYNTSADAIDLSNWSLTVRPGQQAVFSSIKVPNGTKLQPKGFYLLGLSNSGLVLPAHAGDTTLSVRSTTGMSVGDEVTIGTGSDTETREIAETGTAASDPTTLWQPLPDGPLTLPPGSTNVPVQSVSGFKVGEKIALGYGAAPPFVGRGTEQYETATVTAVGKPGMQAYLAANAVAGTTNLKVTSVSDIAVGDRIRLDIESVGHGIETITVKSVGTKASQTNLIADASAGASRIKVRRSEGFTPGDRITIGTPATKETVVVSSVESGNRSGAEIAFTPALVSKHGRDEWVVSPGSGIELTAPLRFDHAANLPFSDRGTGITFTPATRFAHLSNEPVQALGSGMKIDTPLSKSHAVHAVVGDPAVTNAGYRGEPRPDQWFGGPELSTNFLQFGRSITIREGSMVLRDASGTVVDSLNYGGLVDPWAAKGYQAASGPEQSGCYVPSPDPGGGGFGPGAGVAVNRSAGRFPDGADSDSNCTDFSVQAVSTLPTGSIAGSTRLKVASVTGFRPSEEITVDTGDNVEKAAIAAVGSAGATTMSEAIAAGAMVVPVANAFGFRPSQIILIEDGGASESAVVTSIRRFNGVAISIGAPLKHSYIAGSQVSGTGLTLTSALTRTHAAGAQVTDNLPTPGAPNRSQPGLAEGQSQR